MTPSIVQMLESDTMTAVCAPMVRYSKLPFRETVLKWGVDVVYTPMIMADVFSCSQVARECDFTSSGDDDRPLVVQFAARNACDFGAAARLVAPYADAVDLNCGCPQRWAIREKLGSWLLGGAACPRCRNGGTGAFAVFAACQRQNAHSRGRRCACKR